MSKVSISEAIRMAGISRSHFYSKYINKGVISVHIEDNKKTIDVSELIRVFGNVDIKNSSIEHVSTVENTVKHSDKDRIIELLEKQLSEAISREKQLRDESQEREDWLKSQLEKTTYLLENKQPQEPIKRKKFLGLF
jgi:hypothetical protein